MSAIENCRTAVLGSHVVRCEDCSYGKDGNATAAPRGRVWGPEIIDHRDGGVRIAPRPPAIFHKTENQAPAFKKVRRRN
jgi:hypothetical protein